MGLSTCINGGYDPKVGADDLSSTNNDLINRNHGFHFNARGENPLVAFKEHDRWSQCFYGNWNLML